MMIARFILFVRSNWSNQVVLQRIKDIDKVGLNRRPHNLTIHRSRVSNTTLYRKVQILSGWCVCGGGSGRVLISVGETWYTIMPRRPKYLYLLFGIFGHKVLSLTRRVDLQEVSSVYNFPKIYPQLQSLLGDCNCLLIPTILRLISFKKNSRGDSALWNHRVGSTTFLSY